MYKGKISNTSKIIFISTTKTLISENPRVNFVVVWDRLVRLLYIQVSDCQSHWDRLVRLLYTQSEPVSLVCRVRRHLSFEVTLHDCFEFWTDSTASSASSSFDVTLHNLDHCFMIPSPSPGAEDERSCLASWVLMWLYTVSTFWVLIWLYTIFDFLSDSTDFCNLELSTH